MIFITKTTDYRFYYLKLLLDNQNECMYSNTYNNEIGIDKIILPFDGLDQFGYIKHTNILLEKILEKNKVTEIYTGKINKVLNRIALKNKIAINSFYENKVYLKEEFDIKIDVIKTFLEEKFNTRFNEINVLIIGDCYFSYVLGEKFKCKVYSKGCFINKMSDEEYDVIINFSDIDLSICSEKLIIEMNGIEDIDLSILLNCRKIFFIDQLISQYLTKSGGKLMYDCMVKR